MLFKKIIKRQKNTPIMTFLVRYSFFKCTTPNKAAIKVDPRRCRQEPKARLFVSSCHLISVLENMSSAPAKRHLRELFPYPFPYTLPPECQSSLAVLRALQLVLPAVLVFRGRRQQRQ